MKENLLSRHGAPLLPSVFSCLFLSCLFLSCFSTRFCLKQKLFSSGISKILPTLCLPYETIPRPGMGIGYNPNWVSLETSQNEEGFLVLLDTYFQGWKVEVEGKPEHIHRANYFYRGVRLGPGSAITSNFIMNP